MFWTSVTRIGACAGLLLLSLVVFFFFKPTSLPVGAGVTLETMNAHIAFAIEPVKRSVDDLASDTSETKRSIGEIKEMMGRMLSKYKEAETEARIGKGSNLTPERVQELARNSAESQEAQKSASSIAGYSREDWELIRQIGFPEFQRRNTVVIVKEEQPTVVLVDSRRNDDRRGCEDVGYYQQPSLGRQFLSGLGFAVGWRGGGSGGGIRYDGNGCNSPPPIPFCPTPRPPPPCAPRFISTGCCPQSYGGYDGIGGYGGYTNTGNNYNGYTGGGYGSGGYSSYSSPTSVTNIRNTEINKSFVGRTVVDSNNHYYQPTTTRNVGNSYSRQVSDSNMHNYQPTRNSGNSYSRPVTIMRR